MKKLKRTQRKYRCFRHRQKNFISTFLLLTMLLSLVACGSEAAPFQKTSGRSTYYGTWEAVSYEKDGVAATVEALEKSGNYTLSHTGLILRDDGRYYFYTPFNDEIAEWKVTTDGINADGDNIRFSNNKLALNVGTNEVYYFFKTSADMTFPEDRNISNDYFYGTWSVVGGYVKSTKLALTLAQIKSSYDSYIQSIIFSNTGKACVQSENKILTGDWKYSSGKIQFQFGSESAALTLKDNLIYLPFGSDNILFFEKSSADQTIPETSTETGLRPKFKEAMDSYEAFYDEYCEFMKKYKANPTDLTLLTQYTTMLTKLSDMNAKFKAWKSEDLNAEELKYYLEVSNRVMQKMLEVAQ